MEIITLRERYLIYFRQSQKEKVCKRNMKISAFINSLLIYFKNLGKINESSRTYSSRLESL